MAVKVCGASWNRVRADHRALQVAMRELEHAQGRRHSVNAYGRGDLTKRQRKAIAAISQAVSKVKAAGMRLAKSERVWASCSRKSAG